MKKSHELEVAIQACRAAGKIHMKYFQKSLTKTMKIGNDFATQADFESEKKIVEILRKEFPNDGIIAEESGQHAAQNESQWIVDPLDGTIIYSHGLPYFGPMIALQKNQRLEVGVIYLPAQNQLLVAERNKGTYLNEKRVYASTTTRLEESLLAYNTIRALLNQYPQGFKQLLNSVHWRIGLPSLVGIQHFVQGFIDTYCGSYQQASPLIMRPWDIAAKKIIIEESGGILSNTRGQTRLEDLDAAIIANPRLHTQVIQTLNQFKEATK